MAIEIVLDGEMACPKVICDECSQVITDASEAITLFNHREMRETGRTRPLFVHQACDTGYRGLH
jgi:hypothetical protein